MKEEKMTLSPSDVQTVTRADLAEAS